MCILAMFVVASASASDLNETSLSEIDDAGIGVEEIDQSNEELGTKGIVEGENLEILSTNYTPKDSSEIQSCVDSANSGDTIILDGYYLIGNSIKVNKDLTFVGKNDATVDGISRVQLFSLNSQNVIFNNITFKNGFTRYGGGAIDGVCNVINCTFIDNSASQGGALDEGNAINCTFIGNSANYGGAICDGSAVNCTFINNTGGAGGAISDGSAVNCTFINNSAIGTPTSMNNGLGSGGAVRGWGNIENCTFIGNSAKIDGGAVWEVSAINCTFINNTAGGDGGAICDGSAVNCTFIGNSAGGDGGAIFSSYNYFASNSTFVGNSAKNGGAMYQCNAINCSFNNNSALDNGGALYYGKSVVNCSFNNNSASNGGAIFNTYVFGSLFENNSALIDGGAMYGARANNCTFNNNKANRRGGAVCDAIVSLNSIFSNNEASEGKDTCNVTFMAWQTFKDLNKLINDNNNSEIYLTQNYIFDKDIDSGFENGITVNHVVTVHGNGFLLDGSELARIFNELTENVILSNIIFKNAMSSDSGGAINGECTIINCTFINNVATGYQSQGGAINGSCTVINCTFQDNWDTGYSGHGGAIAGGSAINCTFINNYVAGVSNSYGGALYNCNAINCTFIGNSASDGGAVYGGSAVNCTFINNSASIIHVTYGSQVRGGAIMSSSAIGCTFINNSAIGYYSFGGSLFDCDAINCTFINNSAIGGHDSCGGAAYFTKEGSVMNCTFINNSARGDHDICGGAVYFIGKGSVMNCSFVDNFASGDGGAVYGGQVINSIFNNNSAIRGGALYMSACSKCEFYNNSATQNAGAMSNGKSTDCIFIGNSAINGGAIFDTNVVNSKFESNSANNGGAMYYGIAINCTFNNNVASQYGGAVCNAAVSTDSIFKNNKASIGDDTFNVTFFLSGKNFQDLNLLINGNNNSEIYLYQDYTYEGFDVSFVEGITINRALTIYGNGFTIDGGNYVRIFNVIDSSVIIKDVIFINAVMSGYGGAICGNCTLINCTFISNVAAFGGAICGNCTVINCTFVNNSVNRHNKFNYPNGGAIYGNCVVINCSFTGNYVDWYGGGAIYGNSKVFNSIFEDNSAQYGGAMFDGSAVNCTFVSNSADSYGGAMYGGSAVNCTFISNSASKGGAVYGGSAVNCTFVSNNAYEGGAMYGGSAVNCSFKGNSATRAGGAMYGGSASNCRITGNSAFSGGALFGGSAVNCTFDYNYAPHKWGGWDEENAGGAIYNSEVSNCSFIGNSAPNAGAMYGGSATNSTFIDNTATDGDSVEGGIVIDCVFDILPKNTIFHYTSFLKVDDLSMTLGDEGYLIANLSNVQGPIANRTIIFTFNGNSYNATTDNRGLARLNINNIISQSGTFNFFVSFEGDGINYQSFANAVVGIKSRPTLDVNDLNIFMEDNSLLIANLSDVSGPMFGKIITFSVDGKSYNVTTDFEGLAKLPIKNILTKSGSYEVNVSFMGDDFTAPAFDVSYVVIKKYDSILKVDDLNIKVDEIGMLIASLYDSRGQLENRDVSFKVNGKTYVVSTNLDGLAKLDLRYILTGSGDYDFAVSYDGDDYNNPVSVNVRVIIKKYDTVLEVNNVSVVLGDDAILVANLSDSRGALPNKNVIFVVNGIPMINATGIDGLARFNVREHYTEYGTFSIAVAFVGDDSNNPVVSSANVILNKFIYNLTINQEGRYYDDSNLTFKLVDSKTNASVCDTQITLTFSNNVTVTKSTDSKGEFTYEIPFVPGEYDVAASISDQDTGLNTLGLSNFEISSFIGNINIVQNENCRILNIKLYNPNNGDVFRNLNVTLSFEPIGQQFNVMTNDEGIAIFNMDFDFGEYSVVANVLGDYMEFDTARLEGIVINNNPNSKITAQDVLEYYYLDSGYLGVNVEGGSLSLDNIYIDGHPKADIDLIAGSVIVISNLDAGNYTLCIKSTPKANYNAVTRNVLVIVKKINSTISVSDMTFDYGDVGQAHVNISGGNLTLDGIHVVGHAEAVIAVNGTTVCVSNLSVGTYNLSVTTSPDSNHESSSFISQITVNKVDSIIEIDDIIFDYEGSGYSNLNVIGGSVSVENMHVVGQDALIRVSGNVVSVSGLQAGEYTLCVSSNEDDNHNSVTRNVGITVKEIDSTVDYFSTPGDYGSSSFTFLNLKGCRVLEEDIFVVNHPEAIIHLEDNKITVSNLSAGNYILNITSTPDKNHKSVTRSASITVNKVDSAVKLRDLSFDYLKSDTAYVTVYGGSILNENIKVVGHPEAVIDFKNDMITVSNLSAGSYTLRIVTTPDENHNSVVSDSGVTVNKIDSEIEFTSDEITFDEGGIGYTNISIVGCSVLERNIEVIGHSEAVINITGNCISVSNLTAEIYTLHVLTTPDENHNSVFGFITVIVRKIPSIITFENEIVFDFNGVGNTTVNVIGGSVDPSDITVLGHPEADIHINNKNMITVRNLTADNYVLQVKTIPDADHRSSVGYVNITVNRITSKISCDDVVSAYDEIIMITVNVDGGVLNTSSVRIEEVHDANVRANGNSISISGLNVGSYTLYFSSIPDKNHFTSNNTASITVKRIDSTVKLSNPIVFDYGGSDYTSVYLEGCSVSLENISVLDSSGNRVNAKITYSNDVISVSDLAAGSYWLNVVSTPDSNHKSVTSSMNVTVNRVSSEIKSYSPIVFSYLGVGSTYITVDGGGLSSSKMSVSGHSEAVISYAGNQIRVSNLNPGSYSLRVESIPDANHNVDVKYISVTVNKAPVIIEAKSKTVAFKKGSWTVRVLDSKNNPLSNMQVILHVYTGKKFTPVKINTNARGEATFATKGLSKGTHKVIASIEHIGYSANPVTSSIKVIKQTKLNFKVKKNVAKDGSSLSITVKKGKKGINGVKIKLLIYTGKKLTKTVTLKSKKKGKYNGVCGWGTNKLTAGNHKIVIKPAKLKFSGSKTVKLKITKSALKYPKWETKI